MYDTTELTKSFCKSISEKTLHVLINKFHLYKTEVDISQYFQPDKMQNINNFKMNNKHF